MRPFSRLSCLLGVVLFSIVPGTLSNFDAHSPLVLSLNWQAAQLDGGAENTPANNGFDEKVILNGWEKLSPLWPRSKAPGCQSDHFLYLNPAGNTDQQQTLKLNPSELPKNAISLKARFNIWIQPAISGNQKNDNVVVLRGVGNTISILDRYQKYWGEKKSSWMSVEVDLSEMKDKLEDFKLQITNQNIFVALSCFEMVFDEEKHYPLAMPESLTSDLVDKLNKTQADELKVDDSYTRMDEEKLSFLHEFKDLQKNLHKKCFKMNYILGTDDQASLKIVLNYGNSSSYASTLFQEQLESGTEELEFCFNQMVFIQIEDYSLSVTLTKAGNGSLIYSYQFPDFTEESDPVIKFLAPFDGKAFKDWSKQWFESENEKVVFEENSIKIEDELEKDPKRIQFSSKWIKGDIDAKYEFKSSKPDNTKLRIEYCDLTNLCHPAKIPSPESRLQFSSSSYFRIQVTVEFVAHPADLPAANFEGSAIEIDFRLVETNQPCSSANLCGQNGKCEIQPESQAKCSCNKGFYGDKCEFEDKCDADLKNCEGKLGCKRLENDFVCLCDGGAKGEVLWNKETKNCDSKKASKESGTVKEFTFSSTELPDFNQYELVFHINYEYTPATGIQAKLVENSPFVNVELFGQSIFREPLRSGKHLVAFPIKQFIPLYQMLNGKDLSAKFSISPEAGNGELKSFEVFWNIVGEASNFWAVKEGSDYQKYFEDNLKFVGWKSLSQFSSKAEVDRTPDVEMDAKEHLKLTTKLPFIFTTLSTDWFKFNKNAKTVSLALPATQLTTKILAASAVVFDYEVGNVQTFKLEILDGKLEEKSLEDISKKWFETSRTSSFVKFNIEVYSEQTSLELSSPLKLTTKTVCSAEKTCSNSGDCFTDLWTDSIGCNCKTGHFGDDCQFNNDRCEINKKADFCKRSPREIQDSPADKLCVPLNNTAFRCHCVEPAFQWNEHEERCIPTIYQATTNIAFEPEAIQSFKWMSKSPYWSMTTDQQFFKADPSAKNLQLPIQNLPDDRDLCLTIEKSLTKAHIQLAINKNEPLTFEDEDSETCVCVRQLASPDTKFDKAFLSISAPFGNDSFVAFKILKPEVTSRSFSPEESVVLERQSSKWNFKLPTRSGIWNRNNEDSDALNQKFKGETTIFSEWLYNNPEHYSFGDSHQIKFNLVFEDSDNSDIHGKVFDSKMKDITKTVFPNRLNLTSGLNTISLPFNLLPKDDYFRFALNVFKIDSSPATKETAISGFSVNDFCGKDDKEKCSGNGVCKVVLAEKTGFNCTCDEGFDGPVCGKKDYCTQLYPMDDGQKPASGNAICKKSNSGSCVSENFDFKCDCDHDSRKIWLEKKRVCAELDACALANPCQKDRATCSIEDGKPECKCNEGYHKVKGTNRCEPRDPCETNKVCNGINGQCFPLRNEPEKQTVWDPKNPPKNIFCHCPKNFVYDPKASEIAQKYTCKAVSVCDSAITNPCQYGCESEGALYKCSCPDGYKLADDKKACVVDGKSACGDCNDADLKYCDISVKDKPVCKCRDKFILKDGKCVVDVKNMDCPSGKALYNSETGKITCDCSKNPMFDETPGKDGRCQLRKYCIDGSEELKTCQGESALCVVSPLTTDLQTKAKNGSLTAEDMYSCECPTGTHRKDKKCVPHCADSRIVDKCAERNAFCVPTAKPKNWEKVSEMAQDLDTVVCLDCFPGFKQVTGKCVFQQTQSEQVINFDLSILRQTFDTIQKNEIIEKIKSEVETAEIGKVFENPEDMNEYLEGISKANIELQKEAEKSKEREEVFVGSKTIDANIQKFVDSKEKNAKVRVLKCNPQSPESVLCNFELRLSTKANLKADKIREFFVESCQKLQGETDRCSIFLLDDVPAKPQNFMAFDGDDQLDVEPNAAQAADSIPLNTLLVVETKSLEPNTFKSETFNPCDKYSDICPAKTLCHKTEGSFECSCDITQKTGDLWKNSPTNTANKYNAVVNECKLDEAKALTMCPKTALYNGNATILEKNLKPSVKLSCDCSDGIAVHDNATVVVNEYVSVEKSCVEKDFCAGYQCGKGKCIQVKADKTFVPNCKCDDGWKGDHCETEVAVKKPEDPASTTPKPEGEDKKKVDKADIYFWVMIGLGAALCLLIIVVSAWLIASSKSRDRSGSGSFIADNFELRTPHNVGTYRRSQDADPSENLPPSIQITRFGGAGNVPRTQEVRQRHSQSNVRYESQPAQRANYQHERDNESHTSDESDDERPEVEMRHVSSVGQHVRQLSAQFEAQQRQESSAPEPGQSRMSAESRFHPVYRAGSSAHDDHKDVSRSGSYSMVNPAIKNLQAATRNLGNETDDH